MMRAINGTFGDGQQHVTCYTCHRGLTDHAVRRRMRTEVERGALAGLRSTKQRLETQRENREFHGVTDPRNLSFKYSPTTIAAG